MNNAIGMMKRFGGFPSGAVHGSAQAWFLAFLLSWLMTPSSPADEGQFRFSTGFDYSSGKYDDESKTRILYNPYRVGYRQGNLSGQLSVSWISIDGPGTVIDGGVVVPGVRESRRESGIGDTWISITYWISKFPVELGFVDVTAKLKIPTADEDKGLGTGEFDQVLQFDYMYPLDRLTPMATFAYKKRGDPPGVDLNDSVFLSAGADWRQTDRLHFGATLDYQQASVEGLESPLDFFSYSRYKITSQWDVMPYMYFGLSKGSPDYGGGIQLSYKP